MAAAMAGAMRVAVIGAGIGGLTAALRLVAAGVDARVLDAAPVAGGVLGTSRVDGFLREHAATAVLAGAPGGLADLCDELGVALASAQPAARRRWIWIDGALRALPGGPLAFARSDLLTWRGKLSLLAEPLRPARRGAASARLPDGDESVHDWAARRFGPEVARAIIAPFVTGVYAADAHDVGLAAGFPKLAALEARGGVVRGALAQVADRLRGKGGPRSKRRGLVAPTGGMQAVVDALTARLGDRVRTGAAVSAVVPDDAGVAVDGERYDAAVLAVPASAASALIGGALPVLGSRLGALERAPAAIVYLGYERAAIGHPLDGFGFLVAHGEELRVLGVVFESVVWPNRAPDGQVLLRCILAGARDPAAYDESDQALIAQSIRDVEKALHAYGPPRHASVVRWREGVAQYPVGHAARVAELDALAQGRRLVLAGAAYHGAAVNDIVADARRVAEVVARWR
jgi:oxygen-dependent protoporphyrinogen oxidase